MPNLTHTLEALLLLVGSVVFLMTTLFSRSHTYQPWAKVVSVLVFICSLIWGGGRLLLDHLDFSKSTGLVLNDVRKFFCGMGVGLLVAFLIAKPYRKMTREESKSAA